MESIALLLAAALGYLLGSIPSGLILAHLAGFGDIRSIGSGNIGATNVLRTGNRVLAGTTLLFDVAKGVLAGLAVPYVLTATLAANAEFSKLAQFSGLAAFLGHLFPAWLSFKGGKGVATYIGVAAAIFWPAAIIFCAIWFVVAVASRYSSLSALAAAIAAPLAAAVSAETNVVTLFVLMSILLIWKHHANIRRLLEGKEPKIGAKS